MPRHVVIALGTAVALGACAVSPGEPRSLVAVAAIAQSVDPQRSVDVTEDDAVAIVGAFVGSSDSIDRLEVRGPSDGAYQRFYDVAGGRVVATVDVHTGAVVTLVDGSAIGIDSPVKIPADVAAVAAERYLADRNIPVDGLTRSIRLANHGESSEYVVEWSRQVDGVVVPDFRLVGVDATTGRVFRYVNFERPFEPPGKPSVAEPKAVAAAIAAVGHDGAQLDRTELRVIFTLTGTQRLVWNVFLTDEPAASHWVVEVDAASGEAVVLGTS